MKKDDLLSKGKYEDVINLKSFLNESGKENN